MTKRHPNAVVGKYHHYKAKIEPEPEPTRTQIILRDNGVRMPPKNLRDFTESKKSGENWKVGYTPNVGDASLRMPHVKPESIPAYEHEWQAKSHAELLNNQIRGHLESLGKA
jgi:hypothetical protein